MALTVTTLGPILLVGFLGYGVSLVLFVLALRGLGNARVGACFSTPPFLGAVISILILGESVSLLFLFAAALMAIGVWIYLTENHAHEHQHNPSSTAIVISMTSTTSMSMNSTGMEWNHVATYMSTPRSSTPTRTSPTSIIVTNIDPIGQIDSIHFDGHRLGCWPNAISA